MTGQITVSPMTLIYVVLAVLSIGMLVGWFLKGKYGTDAAAAKALESSVASAVAEVKPVEAAVKTELTSI